MASASQAVLLFALLVSPGFVLVQGYRRGRSYTVPDRDLYVLAQAVVASLGWLAIVWLLLLVVGDPLRQWGIVPENTRLLMKHQGASVALLLGVEFAPFGLGLASGSVVDTLQDIAWARSYFKWTGLFEPPTAWDQAWNGEGSQASTSSEQSIDVSVRLKGGGVVEGRYGRASRAHLSPRPDHQLFVETGKGLEDRETSSVWLGDGTIGGVFIDASEIAAIYFKS